MVGMLVITQSPGPRPRFTQAGFGTGAPECKRSKLGFGPATPHRPSRQSDSSGGNPGALRQGARKRAERLPGEAVQGAGGAGRDPEANGGVRPSRCGRRPRTGPQSCSRPSRPPGRHHAPVPGEWRCRGAGRGLRTPPGWPGPGAWAWVPRARSPRACSLPRLSGWPAGFCFGLAHIPLPVFFCSRSNP